ncbi:MAG: diacylglycerol kinase family protein [Spirochaetia bacterium]|nr:diacylglycerol kinase family protein [Spirochaetia bacterium]
MKTEGRTKSIVIRTWKLRPFSPIGRLKSFAHAGSGVLAMFRSQPNAWIHLAATAVVIFLGMRCHLGPVEWSCLALAIAGVWTAEAFNTALEFLTDLVSPKMHPLAGKAKDAAAAAVLLMSGGSLAVGLFIFVPHFTRS